MIARRLHLVVIGAALVPVVALGARALTGGLGANPIEELEHTTGDWSLRFLLLTLAVTPARRLLGWRWIAPLRRTLGLVAFTYVTLHALTYVGLDQLFDAEALLEDLRKRRYVTAGFAGFLCLLPLAATSTARMMKRLGRRWVKLHRLAYVAAVCGVVHYLWLVKADLRAPLIYAAVLALLLGYRLWFRWAPAR
ncbi:MAG: sulfoxide reductase heme-binding subunit YedZ [Myxococcales bacterium]|nr:sulfoxide reductase heme-binding subunit YedZ [Myxococcales bacterium]